MSTTPEDELLERIADAITYHPGNRFGTPEQRHAVSLTLARSVTKVLRPHHGDTVETWLTAQRDRWSEAHDTQWDVINDLLDNYRAHADFCFPLGRELGPS